MSIRAINSVLILCFLTTACGHEKKTESASSPAVIGSTNYQELETEEVEVIQPLFIDNNLAQRLGGRLPETTFYERFRYSALDSLFKFNMGPFTIIALEESSAVDKLIYATRNSKDSTQWLRQQVIAAKYTSPEIYQGFSMLSSQFEVNTLSGESVTFKIRNDSLLIELPQGNTLFLKTTDLEAKNGVLHIATLLD